jgi:hypothetical protein
MRNANRSGAKRLLTGALAAAGSSVLVVGLTAGPAAAHDHRIETPGQGDPVIGEEPFHGDDPSSGAILANPNVDSDQHATWGMHPIHHFLHLGPSHEARAITVHRM